ncbi:MAG: hypothetical protein WB037_07075, partial [Pseudolabrys sp.]
SRLGVHAIALRGTIISVVIAGLDPAIHDEQRQCCDVRLAAPHHECAGSSPRMTPKLAHVKPHPSGEGESVTLSSDPGDDAKARVA